MNVEAVFNAIVSFLNAYGAVATAIVLLTVIWRIIRWARGVVPLALRAGNIRGNKFAIFAKGDKYDELVASLDTTRLYNKKSFFKVASVNDMDTADGKQIFIVNWEDWGDDIQKILDKKTTKTGVVIYAKPGAIPHDTMDMLQTNNFVTVTNFRGRLITDLLSMSLTIRYAKR
tara:strand:- start:12740 stop:13258 length:519 start_codon:yes stop_codon:yes gene_type:complete